MVLFLRDIGAILLDIGAVCVQCALCLCVFFFNSLGYNTDFALL